MGMCSPANIPKSLKKCKQANLKYNDSKKNLSLERLSSLSSIF